MYLIAHHDTLTDKASAKYLASSSVNPFPVGTKQKCLNIQSNHNIAVAVKSTYLKHGFKHHHLVCIHLYITSLSVQFTVHIT